MRSEVPVNEAHALSFTVAATVLGVAFSLGVYGAIAWDLGWLALACGCLLGAWTFAGRIQQHDERGWRIVEHWQRSEEQAARPAQQVIIRSPGREWVYIETDDGRQYVFQPAPGAFAGFLRDVLSDSNRIEFSQRQATERGWQPAEYAAVVAQLQAVGWLTAVTRNGAPTLDRARVDEMRDWLASLPPYPD